MAENNWWNRTPPTYPNYYYAGDFYTSYGGSVDYDPALQSDPLGGMMKVASNGVEGSNLNQQGAIKSCTFFDSKLKDALNKLLDEKYEDALNLYVKRLKKETDKSKKKYILTRIAECYELSGKKGFIQFLNDEVRQNLSKNDELYATTLELEDNFYMSDGNFDKVVENLNTLKENFSESSAIYKSALYGLVNLYYHNLKDISSAQAYLNEMKEKYPKDILTRDAMFLLGEVDSSSFAPGNNKEVASKEETSATIALLDNYPNPFNPSTIISYQLPVTSQVSIRIYDMLGREVVVLADGIKGAGTYTASFDGSHLASGIYFARFTATPQNGNQPFMQTMKMLLTK
jgi:tetratricopeptide (TPR) repeat protein